MFFYYTNSNLNIVATMTMTKKLKFENEKVRNEWYLSFDFKKV